MPLLPTAFTEKDSGATCEAVGRLSPEPIQTAAPPPKALGRHGLGEILSPHSLVLVLCASYSVPAIKRASRTFFSQIATKFVVSSPMQGAYVGDNPRGAGLRPLWR
jgi:hypothetical protein